MRTFMLRRWYYSFPMLLLALSLLLSGCAPLPAHGQEQQEQQPVAVAATGTPYATLVGAPPNATPTPTPFRPLPPTPIFLPTGTQPPTATPLPTATPRPDVVYAETYRPDILESPPEQMNVLLLGSDRRPWDTNFRTDTIILATVNTKLGTINLTSFPRDLFVRIPGWGMNRINTAYYYGGVELLFDTLETNFGVRPDHYVLIDFSSFKRAVDGLGGLEVDVKQPLTDYRNGYGYVTISEGKMYMDADMVLWYVRSRKTSNDFARGKRQQEVLQALMEKFLTMDVIRRAPEFYDIYKDSVTTDLSFSDVVPLMPMAAHLTDSSRLKHYYIGPKQVYNWITPQGAMVLMPVPAEIQAVLEKSLNMR